jgi:hypothetical protein
MQAHDDVGEAQECIDVDAIACHERGDVTDRTIRAIDRPQAARLFDVVTGPGWRPSYEELL